MTPHRIVIVAGSGRGKSTTAEEYRRQGYAVFCCDPLSRVKEPLMHVTYLPEGLGYAGDGGAGDWIARHWLNGIAGTNFGPCRALAPMPARWVVEGHKTAAALLRWLESYQANPFASGAPSFPCDRVIVLDRENFRQGTEHYKPGQDTQHKGVMTTWGKIAGYYRPITEWRRE